MDGLKGMSSSRGLLWESVLRKSLRSEDPERLVAAIGLAESGGAGDEVLHEAREKLLDLLAATLAAKLREGEEVVAAAQNSADVMEQDIAASGAAPEDVVQGWLQHEAMLRQQETQLLEAMERSEEAAQHAVCHSVTASSDSSGAFATQLSAAREAIARYAQVRSKLELRQLHRKRALQREAQQAAQEANEFPSPDVVAIKRRSTSSDSEAECHVSVPIAPPPPAEDNARFPLTTMIGRVGMAAGEIGTGVPIAGSLASLRRGSPGRRQSPDPKRSIGRQSPGRLSPIMVGRSVLHAGDTLEAGLSKKYTSVVHAPPTAEQNKVQDCTVQ
eukprot:TRINITY_DN75119_c0_g1_i1.p1 TRINITY_DN75119_c0_g1~~TRINITY_DN75119_c0_g1_i1.p1  ORF type:complete len:330 (+),score=72.12 TRINITY_DN75119_c0_g1_i1:130-1119(+)